MRHVGEIKIFISSPNDLAEERELCRKVIREMEDMIGSHYRIKLTEYTWENSASAVGVGNPQSRTPNPADYDIYLGMLWKQFGTPTKQANHEGKEFESGTYQEFCDAHASCLSTGAPEILFFRKKCTTEEDGLNQEQREHINRFFDEFRADGHHPGIFARFEEKEELAVWIRKCLFDYVRRNDPGTNLHGHYEQYGIKSFFLREDNRQRNDLKAKALNSASRVRLLAHTGYSYLSEYANRFFLPLNNCLKRGGKVEIVVANPYSETGYYLTLGDLPSLQNESIAERLGSITDKDPVALIKDSGWVSHKLDSAIRGYLHLRKLYGDRITLRFTKFETSSTILIADDTAFFEPYMHCIGSTRGMNAFEVQLQNQHNPNDVYDSVSQYFDLHWQISESYEDYIANKSKHKAQLKRWCKAQVRAD